MITLKTLPQATAQEVFDQVTRHLLTQNKRSAGEGNACFYKNKDGLKCAAGCLIGDDEYKSEFEKRRWFDLIDNYNFPNIHSVLIKRLQITHDNLEPSNWHHYLKTIAIENNLKFEFEPSK